MFTARFCRVSGVVLLLIAAAPASWATIPATFLSDLSGPVLVHAMVPLNGGVWLDLTGITSEVWFSDGTREGTAPIAQVPTLLYWDDPTLYALHNKVLFATGPIGALDPLQLWVSDGTGWGTKKIAEGYVLFLGGTAQIAFFSGYSGLLWRTDGTTAGTFPITSVPHAYCSLTNPVLDNVLYLSISDEENGTALWRTDGTQPGTWLVKVINGEEFNMMNAPIVCNGKLFFVGRDPVLGAAPYVSDGTSEGTHIIKDLAPESADNSILMPLALQSWGFMLADDTVHGFEPWKTDGTAEGTVMLNDILPGEGNSLVGGGIAALGNTVYFDACPMENHRQLWKSDGTQAGTVAVSDVIANTEPLYSGVLNESGGYVYYQRFQSVGDTQIFSLYRVNNTTPPALVTTLTQNIPEYFSHVWTFGDFVYFGRGDKLYRVNGTTAERVILEDAEAGRTGYGYCDLDPVCFNGYLYICGEGLWLLDTLNFRFIETPHSQKREIGDSLLLRVSCRSTAGGLTYQWVKDTFDIPDATSPTYQVEDLTEDDEGWYSCRVTDDSKTVHETTPVFIDIFPQGSLPAATTPSLCIMALACTMWGVRRICRKQ